VFGAVVNTILVLRGPPGSSNRTNQFLLDPIVSYHFGNGWSVGSSPNITTNWIASGGTEQERKRLAHSHRNLGTVAIPVKQRGSGTRNQRPIGTHTGG
jgi:hypothetical protein